MSQSPKSKRAWILLSGGVDSTTCVAFYQEQGFSVRGFFFDYGQAAAPRECKAATAIATYYSVPLVKLSWSGIAQKASGLIQGRNAFLLVGTLLELQDDCGILAIGIHAGSTYPDCGLPFVRRMQAIFDLYTEGRIQIATPFLKWTKADIWTYAKSRNVPLELTYSCERGDDQPCGLCLSCSDLEALYACT
ncbi:MAG: 7-cyano-7-deazaguanine synthase [Desulfomonilaceae bacterium]